MESKIKNKREKLEDIDINIKEQSSEKMTRTKKRKLQEENQISEVPLEKQISTSHKPSDQVFTVYQIRENEAKKRKEMILRSKANQKYLYFIKLLILLLKTFITYSTYLNIRHIF